MLSMAVRVPLACRQCIAVGTGDTPVASIARGFAPSTLFHCLSVGNFFFVHRECEEVNAVDSL